MEETQCLVCFPGEMLLQYFSHALKDTWLKYEMIQFLISLIENKSFKLFPFASHTHRSNLSIVKSLSNDHPF